MKMIQYWGFHLPEHAVKHAYCMMRTWLVSWLIEDASRLKLKYVSWRNMAIKITADSESLSPPVALLLSPSTAFGVASAYPTLFATLKANRTKKLSHFDQQATLFISPATISINFPWEPLEHGMAPLFAQNLSLSASSYLLPLLLPIHAFHPEGPILLPIGICDYDCVKIQLTATRNMVEQRSPACVPRYSDVALSRDAEDSISSHLSLNRFTNPIHFPRLDVWLIESRSSQESHHSVVSFQLASFFHQHNCLTEIGELFMHFIGRCLCVHETHSLCPSLWRS